MNIIGGILLFLVFAYCLCRNLTKGKNEPFLDPEMLIGVGVCLLFFGAGTVDKYLNMNGLGFAGILIFSIVLIFGIIEFICDIKEKKA